VDFDVVYYPLPDLDWTKPKPDLTPEDVTEFCIRQCTIIHEARRRLLEKLKADEGAEKADPTKIFIGLDASKSKSDELYYSPVFKVSSGTRERYFQVFLKRVGETIVDVENPIVIREVTSKIERQK
jgi:hypothetical protein